MSNQGIWPGYKQTEVGVIPEDWEARPLPEMAWFQEGPGLRNWQFTRSGMKVINVTNLENGFLNLDRTERHISLEEFSKMYMHFAVDDTDIVMASSGNSYGKSSIVRARDLPLVMNTSVIRFKPLKSCDYAYLWILLNSDLFKEQIDLMITGGAQPNFGPYHLRRIEVPAPPLPEQRAIAGALSDADGLIAALEGVIAKKRDLKQAAMQQLLTGKTRLPGFSGDWEVKRLGELCSMKSGEGITAKGIDDHSPFPCYGGNGLRGYVGRYTHEGTYCLIGRVGALCGNLLEVTGRFFASEHAIVVEAFDSTDVSWLTRAMGTLSLNRRAESSAQPVLTVSKLLLLEIPAPPSKAEQAAIAEVLSDMDADLAALEARAAKARAVKQGMMQQLLTGKVRLV
ncbi:restriction endonuclease subunit S [Roseovarius tolerans]|uniref:restriction endonuclease subunit S n=1 Tax=Roseovarius tolerans TaxID=74031 RepID=UPI000943EA59|nr:restriction endonuclease subunit S [Roseovarius tolerans]